MSPSPQPHRSSPAATVLLILGSVCMLLALILSVAFYIWGQNAPSYGETGMM